MADGNCWMIDNLSLDLTANYLDGSAKPAWTTAPQKITAGTTYSSSAPQHIQHTNIAGQIQNNGNPKQSYLYNWCATLADTSSTCVASRTAAAYQTVINGQVVSGTATSQPDVTGICPTPFRLPKGGPEATSADPSTTANDIVQLDIAMGGTGRNRTNANTYSYFSGDTSNDPNGLYWAAVFTGNYYGSSIDNIGIAALYYTSTGYGSGQAYYYDAAVSSTNYVGPASGSMSQKQQGMAVRCLL